ncbi:MAG TPA: FHA domain-containing protein [Gemmataceae bacterium]|nr:FHA domain-containing protein [Gemmataceae bacterium]
MPAQLVALGEGPSILLDKPILLVGRHPECDIQLDSRKVSRRHCCIAQVNDYLVVRDLDSTNGIRINGVRVMEGRIGQGDELTIGNCRYQVRWDTAAPAEAAGKGGKMPAAVAPMARVDDDLLEACDEPVPLDESVPFGTVPQPPGLRQPPSSGLPPILPDHLELAPSPSSHSHHPPA